MILVLEQKVDRAHEGHTLRKGDVLWTTHPRPGTAEHSQGRGGQDEGTKRSEYI